MSDSKRPGVGVFVLASALKDLRRRLADPVALVFWLGIPLLIGSLMTLAMGGSDGPAPKAHVLLVDEDDSLVSRLLASGFGGGQSEVSSVLEVERVDRETGRRRIDAGDGSALLIIPEGFSDAVLDETPITLELFTNPSQRILPGIAEEFLSVIVDAVFYIQQILGDPIRQFADQLPEGADAFPDATIASFSVEMNRLMTDFGDLIFPPILTFESVVEKTVDADAEQDSEEEESPSFGLIFLPGILFMSLLFVAQGVSEDIWGRGCQGDVSARADLALPDRRLRHRETSRRFGHPRRGGVHRSRPGDCARIRRRDDGAPAGLALDGRLRRDAPRPLPVPQRLRLQPADREHPRQHGPLPPHDARRELLPVRGHAVLDGERRQAHPERVGALPAQGDPHQLGRTAHAPGDRHRHPDALGDRLDPLGATDAPPVRDGLDR